MPICRKCSERFPNWFVIEGVSRNLSKRKYCLLCSPFHGHNTRYPRNPETGHVCNLCHEKFEYARSRGDRKDTCSSCLNKKQRLLLKKKCIEYKGGKCQACGYLKYLDALTFHHKEPSKKEFTIGGSQNRAWAKLKVELDKCILLCSNCHAEAHARVENFNNAR